ncbi:MAG: PAS domain-containing protein, partial [Flavisolibacter sp.]|nr:PAS domain-containing protein [Flavisolibacter sp.]
MQHTLEKATSPSTEHTAKSVSLFVQSEYIVLSGHWQWEMNSDAVFCSDVMLSLPPQFLGTKGIIHPDDVAHVKTALALIREKETLQLQFRIITTYGEVKTITGRNIAIAEEGIPPMEPEKAAWEVADIIISSRKQIEEHELKKQITETAERLHKLGTWYVNATTGECFYSDNVYHIHGLPPQALNPHPNTFNPFIHYEDAVAVTEAFDKAYAEQLPLHLEYRIVKQNGDVRYVQQITQWSFNSKGESIFSGVLQDLTEQKAFETQVEEAGKTLQFYKQTLQYSEQQTGSGNWTVHLLTRKTSYSDNYFRLYGLKPQTAINPNHFLNLVHPDDHEAVKEATNAVFSRHQAPDLEYRIIRPDGKTRYLRQTGKLMIMPNDELVMLGYVQDITVQKVLEKKVLQLQQAEVIKNTTQQWVEEIAGISTIIWELPEGKMTWNESFYKLIGYKPETKEATQAELLRYILPAERERIADELKMILETSAEKEIQFRMIARGQVRQIKALFKPIGHDGKDLILGLLQDISREVGLQQQLTEQEQLTTLMADTIHDIIIVTDTTNTIISWNWQCEEKTGIKKGEALHKNFFDVFPHLKDLGFANHLQAALSGETVEVQESKGIYLKGYQNFYLSPIINGEQVIGVLHVLHDMSREHELQRHLSERLNFIENLVEASVDRIIVLDRNMNYLYWNKRAENYYGIAKEKVLGKNILEVFPGFRNDPSYHEFRKVLKGETVHIPATVHEDSPEYFETYLTPIKDDRGEVTAVLWLVHDLSKEQALAQEQKDSAETIQQMLNGSIAAICILDSVRDEKGKIIDFIFRGANKAAEAINRMSVEEMTARRLLETFPAVKEVFFDMYVQVVETGEPLRVERHYPYEHFGTDTWFAVSAVKNGDGLIMTFHDITEQKKSQQELKESKLLIEEVTLTIPDLITIHDSATNEIIYANHDNFWVGFYKPEEVYGMKDEQRATAMIHPDDLEKAKSFLQERRMLGDNEVKEVELKMTSEKWIRVRSKIFKRDEEGTATQIISFTTDITEQKNAEQELKERNNFIERLNEATPDILYLMDLNIRHVTYTNRPIAEVLEYEQDEIARMEEPFFAIMHKDDVQAMLTHIEEMKTAADGEVREIEYRLKHAKGHWVWLKDRNAVFERDNNGVPVFKIGI